MTDQRCCLLTHTAKALGPRSTGPHDWPDRDWAATVAKCG